MVKPPDQNSSPDGSSARHWHVLGAGAMGCLFAAALQRAGCDVTLLLRDPKIRGRAQVRIERAGDQDETLELPIEGAAASTSISHLLVTTKAYDVLPAVQSLKNRLAPDCQVLLMVNGMGLGPPLQTSLPGAALFFGTSTEGAYRKGPLHICHAGTGATRIGAIAGEASPDWFEDFRRGLRDCQWDCHVNRALWHKLAINCAINPLTALHRCPNGELATRRELAAKMTELCEEISAVSRAAGFIDTADNLVEAAETVVAGTANNRSSMLQDITAGRRTEIDHITGYLLQVAAEHGVATPLNQQLLEEIHRLDR